MVKKKKPKFEYLNREELRDGRILLYQRADQKKRAWWVRIRVPDRTGYITRSTKTQNHAEAVRFAENLYDELRYKTQHGMPIKSSRFKEVFTKFMKDQIDGGMSIHRQKVFWSFGNRYWAEFFGQKHLERLKSKDFDDYMVWRNNYWKTGPGAAEAHKVGNHAKTPSVNTMRMERQTLLQFLKWAHKQEYIRVVPTFDRTSRMKNTKRGRRPTFTDGEWDTLWRYLADWTSNDDFEQLNKQHQHQRMMIRHAILILAHTGLRPQELKELRWFQVRHEPSKRYKKENKWNTIIDVHQETKTGARMAVGTADCFKYFERLRAYSNHTGQLDYVICDYHGGIVSYWGKTLKKLLQYLGIEIGPAGKRRTAYSFRHFFITSRLEAGVPIHLVAAICGTSISTIEKHYAHLTDAQKMRAASLKYLEDYRDDSL